MDTDSELAIVRRTYAEQVLAAAGIADVRIEHAYAAIPRERFLGPGPWQMYRPPWTYVVTPDANPAHVYANEVVGLVSERGINNGQPSLHAQLIAAAQITEGEHVVHVGAGTGYYSAIMAQLVGPSGRITAIECDPVLASRARDCLSGIANARVLEANGANVQLGVADVIYVNAGVTHPADAWLDGLAENGRLIIPLTTDANFPTPGSAFDLSQAMRSGAYFRIQRSGAAFAAHGLLPTAIIPAQGARDQEAEAVLAAAFAKGGWQRSRSMLAEESRLVPNVRLARVIPAPAVKGIGTGPLRRRQRPPRRLR